ncbi:hypothetical protein [Candidatus Cyanaurora vandensis]|nr:hypothetical protein [Candidatus Cyanaurora vandensis]
MAKSGPQVFGQPPLAFLGSVVLAVVLVFSCLFIGLFIVYILFEGQFQG